MKEAPRLHLHCEVGDALDELGVKLLCVESEGPCMK